MYITPMREDRLPVLTQHTLHTSQHRIHPAFPLVLEGLTSRNLST